MPTFDEAKAYQPETEVFVGTVSTQHLPNIPNDRPRLV